MIRSDLCDLLFAELGMSRAEADAAVKAIFDAMSEALANGEEVKISNFGVLDVRMRAARPGRNPRTGEPVLIPPRRVVVFSAASKLDAVLNGVTSPRNREGEK